MSIENEKKTNLNPAGVRACTGYWPNEGWCTPALGIGMIRPGCGDYARDQAGTEGSPKYLEMRARECIAGKWPQIQGTRIPGSWGSADSWVFIVPSEGRFSPSLQCKNGYHNGHGNACPKCGGAQDMDTLLCKEGFRATIHDSADRWLCSGFACAGKECIIPVPEKMIPGME